MSINRTRWLDKQGLRAPHQADGPRARWHLLRPLMQLLLTSAAPSNIGQGGDTIIQTQNCVSPCAWVKLIFSELSTLRRGHAFFTFKFPATRFVRVILEQGAISSSQGNKKRPEFVRVILVGPSIILRLKKAIVDASPAGRSSIHSLQTDRENRRDCRAWWAGIETCGDSMCQQDTKDRVAGRAGERNKTSRVQDTTVEAIVYVPGAC